MSTLATTIMMLLTLAVDPYRLQAQYCPYLDCTHHTPPTYHHILSCIRQTMRGSMASHTRQARTWQRLCRRFHVRQITTEDASMFTVCPGESGRRGDVVIHPGSLALCAQQSLNDKGVIGDISVTCPTAASLTHRAATADGYAATCREAQKDSHHAGRFSTARWVFTPIVQESFGRLGRRAGALYKELAHHSAHRGHAARDSS